MRNVFIFLAEGFEETEAVATIDVLRRGGIETASVSVTGNLLVKSSHGVVINADTLFEKADLSSADMLILPGGTPGATNLNAHEGVKNALKQFAANGKKIAAICAAPLVLGGLGLLQGKNATVYPGYESTLKGATCVVAPVVKDGNIITGRGPGFSFQFGLAIVEELLGKAKADEVAAGLLIHNS
jgi:4-methyl-5(b-hydroxyethyl)-thiazole monophosphate biosynthesis